MLWHTDGYCVNGKVTTDHPAGVKGGLFRAEHDSERPLNYGAGTIACQRKMERPAGQQAARIVVVKASGSGAGLCYDTGTMFSRIPAIGVDIQLHYANNPPCGPGKYKTQAWMYSDVWGDGEPFNGGSLITSPWHQLPAN